MRYCTMLLTLVMGMPLGLFAAADPIPPGMEIMEPDPDPVADQAEARIDKIERRLEANAKRIETHRDRRESLTATIMTAQENLAKLAALLATIDELTTRAQTEQKASGKPHEGTASALNAAQAAVEPMQRSKRDWTQTVTQSQRALASLKPTMASLEAERGRLERELAKAKAQAGR